VPVASPPAPPRALVEPPRPPSRPVVPPPVAPRPFEAGTFAVERGRAGRVIGAPHGTTDLATDRVAEDLARLTGWGLVVARGFSLDGPGRRLNVNRPTEGVASAAPALEGDSPEARRAYDAYRRHVATAAQGPLELYVEVHGNGRPESAGRIEIATVGVDRDGAWRLKTLLELVRDAHLRARPETARLAVLVEPLDALYYTASAAKAHGLLGTVRRGLHIELPRGARTADRETYTTLLADFLTQAAPLLTGAAR
jgi:hypothetical protein